MQARASPFQLICESSVAPAMASAAGAAPPAKLLVTTIDYGTTLLCIPL